jgi:hypothetical protein
MGQTESDITTSKYQVLNTKYNATKALKSADGSKGIMRQQYDEAVEHSPAECPVLGIGGYIQLQHRVYTKLRFRIYK